MKKLMIFLLCVFCLTGVALPAVTAYAEEKAAVATPSKPTVKNIVDSIRVNWTAVPGVEKYGIWRSETGKNGTYKWLGNPSTNSYQDKKVVGGKTYFYKVTCMDPNTGAHGAKSEAGGVAYVGTPDITQRSNMTEGIVLQWNKIEGATGYGIYRKSYAGTDAWARIATVNGNSTFIYTDTAVKNNNGTVYSYTVRALAGDGKTLSGCRNSGRTMVRLTDRAISSVTAVGDTSAKVVWSTSSKVTGYEVRFEKEDGTSKIFTVGNYKTGVKTFTGLDADTTYRVLVRGYRKVDKVGTFYSAWSDSISVTLKSATIPVPAKPYKVTNVVNGVHVYWKATEGAAKYGVWRSENGENGTYKWLGNPTKTDFTDVTAESGKQYYYRITAMDSTGKKHGEKSGAISVLFVSTPDITGRENVAEGVALEWNRIDGANGYAVYRKSYSGTDAWKRVATIKDNATISWVDSTAVNGTAYRYTVRALAGSDYATLSGCRNAGRTMVRLEDIAITQVQLNDNGTVSVAWTTDSYANGYEIVLLMTDGSVEKKTVTSGKNGSVVISCPDSEACEVQIRSYRSVAEVGKFYSAWSVLEAEKPEVTPVPDRNLGGMNIIIGDHWSTEEPYYDMSNPKDVATKKYRDKIFAKYNFTMQSKAVADWNGMKDTYIGSVASGTPVAQLFELDYRFVAEPMMNGLFYDLSTLEELDFSEDKWNEAVKNLMTKGDSIYGMRADKSEPRAGVIWNKRLFEEAGIDPELPYDLQASGQWTWSAFEELCAKLTRDTNNDCVTDIYATVSQGSMTMTALVASTGSDFFVKDASENLVFNAGSEEVLSALDFAVKLYNLGYEMPQPEGSAWDYYRPAFQQGKAAMQFSEEFMCQPGMDYGDAMEDEVGFVMPPKPDGAAAYHSYVCDNITVIPSCYDEKTASDIAFAYNLYTMATPGYDDPDAWKETYYSHFDDTRAVDETIALFNDGVSTHFLYQTLVPKDLGEDLLWVYPFYGTTPDKQVASIKDSWNAILKEVNEGTSNDTEKKDVVTLNTNSLSDLEVGESFTFIPYVNGEKADAKTMTWKSSDPTVATCVNGYLVIAGAGSTSISCTRDNATVAYCYVTVKGETPGVTPPVTPIPNRNLGGISLIIGDHWSPETPEEPMNAKEEAIQKYREELFEKYNFTMQSKAVSSWGGMLDTYVQSVSAGEPAAQLFELDYRFISLPMQYGMFYDLATLDELDFSEAKWNQAVKNLMTRGDSIYGMRAAKSEPRMGLIWNKRLFEEAGIDPELPYDLQASGEWTWSAFEELCKKLTRDTDNDGVIDVYATVSQGASTVTALVASTGSDFALRDANGNLVNNLDSEEVLDALNFAVDLYNKGYEMPQQEGSDWNYFTAAFREGMAAMQFNEEYMCQPGMDYGDAMDDEIGFVLPPKPDGAEYNHSYVSDNIVVIPSCYDEESASKIAFAYNLYTMASAAYEGENDWKAQYYSHFDDTRAVDETIAKFNDGVSTHFSTRALYEEGYLNENILWAYPWFNGKTPEAHVDSIMDSWNAFLEDMNSEY